MDVATHAVDFFACWSLEQKFSNFLFTGRLNSRSAPVEFNVVNMLMTRLQFTSEREREPQGEQHTAAGADCGSERWDPLVAPQRSAMNGNNLSDYAEIIYMIAIFYLVAHYQRQLLLFSTQQAVLLSAESVARNERVCMFLNKRGAHNK